MSLEGIDVSQWQATTPSLKGLSFLFARASIGTRADTMYDRHIAAARKAGLVTGAYHFGDNRLTPAAQVKAFLAAAGDVDFYFLDVEGRNAMTSAQIKAFFAGVRKAGKKVGLYMSVSGFKQLGQDFNWVAYWGRAAPSIPWTFWQYRGSPLDLDFFNGSLPQLRALIGLPDSSTEEPVRTFKGVNAARTGVIKISGDDHWYLDLATNKLAKVGTAAAFNGTTGRRAYGPVTLVGTGPAIGPTGYVFGDTAAYVQAADVATWTPDAADTKHTVTLNVDGSKKYEVAI